MRGWSAYAIQLRRNLLRPVVPRAARRAAEDAGYDSFIVPDSVIFPAHSDTGYPYTADGDRTFLEDKPIIEPFTLIPYLAGQTTTLRFTTFVLKLAIRPPVLVAKQAASIAVLTGDRLRLGVGISPWPEDFAAMGLPWEKRGARMDETVDIIRGLMSGGWFEYKGDVWQLDRCKITPVPVQAVPILVGGDPLPRSGAPRNAVTDGSTRAAMPAISSR